MEGRDNDKRGFNLMSSFTDRSRVESMKQTKLVSLVETLMVVGIGMLVSLIAWPFIGALYGIPYTLGSHLGITLIFTVLAVIRVYIIRRFFEVKLYNVAFNLVRKYK